jgi:hypothetical protein
MEACIRLVPSPAILRATIGPTAVPNPARREEYTDSSGGTFTNRENPFPEYREQSENASSQTPRWFDE